MAQACCWPSSLLEQAWDRLLQSHVWVSFAPLDFICGHIQAVMEFLLQDEAPGAGYAASVTIFLQVFDFNCPFWLHQKRLGVRTAMLRPRAVYIHKQSGVYCLDLF